MSRGSRLYRLLRVTLPALVLGSLGCFCVPLSAAGEVSLRVGIHAHGRPLSYVEDDGYPNGLVPDIIRALAQEAGISVHLIPGWWSEQLRGFQDGTIHVLGSALAVDERSGEMDFSVPHTRLKAAFYVREDGRPIKRSSELQGKKIAVLSMASGHSLAKIHRGWGGEIVVFGTQQEAIESVRNGQCDTAVSSVVLVPAPNEGLRSGFVDDIFYEFRFAVRKGNAATLALLNDAIANAQRKGVLDDLVYSWTGTIQPRSKRWRDYRHFVLPIAAVLLGGVYIVTRQYHLRMILAERMRIARDLHDELGNRLSEMQMLTERSMINPEVATREFIPQIRRQMVETSESLNRKRPTWTW